MCRQPFLSIDPRAVIGQVVGRLPVIADVRLVAQLVQPTAVVAACGDGGEEVLAVAGALDLVGAVAVDHVKAVRGHALDGLSLQRGDGLRTMGLLFMLHKLTSGIVCAKKQRTQLRVRCKYWLR